MVVVGHAWGWAIAAPMVVLWVGVLCWWDWQHQRLPNALTLIPGAVALVGASIAEPQAVVGLIWPASYLLLAIAQGGLGGGDIKLAVPLGIVVAWVGGMISVLIAMLSAAAVTTVVSLARQRSELPHGPSMFVGAGLGILTSYFLS